MAISLELIKELGFRRISSFLSATEMNSESSELREEFSKRDKSHDMNVLRMHTVMQGLLESKVYVALYMILRWWLAWLIMPMVILIKPLWEKCLSRACIRHSAKTILDGIEVLCTALGKVDHHLRELVKAKLDTNYKICLYTLKRHLLDHISGDSEWFLKLGNAKWVIVWMD